MDQVKFVNDKFQKTWNSMICFNSLNAKVAIKKPDNWFAEPVDWFQYDGSFGV